MNSPTVDWTRAITVAVCLFSVGPVAVVLLSSVTAAGYLSFPPQGFSLKWYVEFARRPEFVQSMITSLAVAACAACVTMVLATCASLAIVRYEFPGRGALRMTFMSPLTIPGLVLGIALLRFYVAVGIPLDLWSLAAAHVVITTPYAIRLISISLTGFDRRLELAARNLGAGPFTTLRLVTFPLIRPGLLSAFLLAFIVSMDDAAVSIFLSSPTTVPLPVRIFTYIDQNVDPMVAAASSISILIAVAIIAILERTVGFGHLLGVRQ